MNHLVQLLKVTARTLVVRAAAFYSSLFAFVLQYMQHLNCLFFVELEVVMGSCCSHRTKVTRLYFSVSGGSWTVSPGLIYQVKSHMSSALGISPRFINKPQG